MLVAAAANRTPISSTLPPAVSRHTTTVDWMVDDYMDTNVDGVYAIGDIANDWQLKHVANAEAKIVFGNLANPEITDRRSTTRPSRVRCSVDPQVASVGLTEEQATAAGRSYRVGRRDFGGTAYGWALEDRHPLPRCSSTTTPI